MTLIKNKGFGKEKFLKKFEKKAKNHSHLREECFYYKIGNNRKQSVNDRGIVTRSKSKSLNL